MTHSFTWLGHGTFLLESTTGTRLMLDPWTEGNPSYPQGFDLGKLDGILVTHGHFDHIASTPKVWKDSPCPVVGIFELCHWLQGKGVTDCVSMNKGGTVSVADVQVTMVHADHSCGITEDDGSIVYGGEAVGFCA